MRQARVCALVQENVALLNSIRENMMMGRFFDNHPLMIAFDKNVKEITALLGTLPFAEMQKLPVQVRQAQRDVEDSRLRLTVRRRFVSP